MENVLQTVISQFGNSPTLLQLINNMDGYIDPSADIDNLFDAVWNISTAEGFGLDIWGRIVGVTRNITISGGGQYFGFSQGAGQPFGQAPFWAGTPATNTYTLSDDAFRILILVKAIANISNCTARSYNQLLQNLFANRGRCYVNDLGNMQMRYVFEFDLLPYEISIITNSGAFPRPAAVGAYAITLDASTTFGFAQAGGQPFGQGVMFNGAGQVTPVA